MLIEDLERKVAEQLEKGGLCIVSDEELRLVWPSERDRGAEVARFATEHNWMLLSYAEEQGAIFASRK